MKLARYSMFRNSPQLPLYVLDLTGQTLGQRSHIAINTKLIVKRLGICPFQRGILLPLHLAQRDGVEIKSF